MLLAGLEQAAHYGKVHPYTGTEDSMKVQKVQVNAFSGRLHMCISLFMTFSQMNVSFQCPGNEKAALSLLVNF